MNQNSKPTQCGFVTLIGIPNAGKSTLLNQLVGAKLAIVTPKVQTTRDVIRGIAIHEKCQIVFQDTPGIFEGKKGFEKAMVDAAWSGARDADAVVLLIDALKVGHTLQQALIEAVQSSGVVHKPFAIWLNKADKVKREVLMELAQTLGSYFPKAEIFVGSALKGRGVEDLTQWLSKQMPEGEWLFPEDHVSDLPMRFIAAEITREKLFLRLQQEIPYGLRVEPELWQEREDGSVRINQVIMVEREAHKKIILGKNGQQLKTVGQSARQAIEKQLGVKVHLFLFVKTVPNWKEKKEFQPLNPHAS